MQVKSLKKGKKNTYILTTDKNQELLLFDDIIVKYELLPNKIILETDLNKIIEENNQLEAYYKTISYLNSKMRSKKEIQKFLEQKDYSKPTINIVIEKLEKERYLNEERYIEAFINDEFRFHSTGPFKIKKKLLDLGLPEEQIEQGLNKISKENWQEKLEKLYQKKANSNHHDSLEKGKLKCQQYFYQLGYPLNWLQEIENKITWQEDEKLIEKEYDKLARKLSRKYTQKELIFQIKKKLYEKGFTKEQIDSITKNSNF